MIDFGKKLKRLQLKREMKSEIIDLICDIQDGKYNEGDEKEQLEKVLERITKITELVENDRTLF